MCQLVTRRTTILINASDYNNKSSVNGTRFHENLITGYSEI